MTRPPLLRPGTRALPRPSVGALLWVLVPAASLAASAAWAQGPVASPAPGAGFQALVPAEAVQQTEVVFQQLRGAISAFATGNAQLVALGRQTAVVLFGVLLVWGIVRSWVLGHGIAQLLPEFIQPVVILGLSLWGVEHLGPVVASSVAAIGQVFAGTLMLQGAPPTEIDVMRRMTIAAFDVLSATPGGSGGGWSELISIVAHQTTGFLYRLASAIVLLLSGAVATGVMLMAQVQTALALMFAPVMIPWAMWRPTTFLFDAWLGFLITGAMQSVMASAVAALSVQVIDRVVQLAASLRADDQMSFVLCSTMFLLSLLVGYLFTKVPALASGLVGGSSLNLERWASVGRGAGTGAAAVGHASVGVAGGTMRFGRGMLEGFRGGLGRRTGATRGTGGGTGPSPAPVAGRTAGRAAAVGRGAGWVAGAAAGALARGRAAPDFPGTSTAAEGTAAAPARPPAAPPRPAHEPYRAPPSARPVNRPVREAE